MSEDKEVKETPKEQVQDESKEPVEVSRSSRIGTLIQALLHEIAADVHDKGDRGTQTLNLLMATLSVNAEIAHRTLTAMTLAYYGDKPEMLAVAKTRLFLARVESAANDLRLSNLDVYQIMLENIVMAERAFIKSGASEETIQEMRKSIEERTLQFLKSQETQGQDRVQ